MTLSDWVMVLAVVLAPVIAVQVQKFLEHYRERHVRKLDIFKTLMATRFGSLTQEHVQALNMIDIEFYGRKHKNVTGAWKTYLDHLGDYPKNNDHAAAVWTEKRAELLAALLMEMGKTLGYSFDVVHVKKGIYYPQALGKLEDQSHLLREGLLHLLYGNSAIKMEVTHLPIHEESLERQLAVQQQISDLLDGNRKLKVEMDNPQSD